jgi:hypothetical protein
MSEDKSVGTKIDEPSTNERRDFLRNSMLAAGAVATLAVAESASAQVCYDASGNIVKTTATPKLIDVTFNAGDLKIDDLYSVIKQLGGITGCLTCGLNGFDLHVHINPVLPLKTLVPSYATVMPQAH